MDYSTSLKWAHPEIKKILAGPLRTLEAIAEGVAEKEQLRDIYTAIHELRLVLELLEVYGGVLLIEEIEVLLQGLAKGGIEQQEDAQEVLMRALLQLPGYLERVQITSQDNPITMLPLLNDMRAVQQRALLSENSLFAPDLSLTIPDQPAPVLESGKITPEALHNYCKRLRPYYQKGLVQWFHGRDGVGGLKLMGAVFEHLERVSGGTEMGRLWWIAAGVVEALRDGGITAGITVKLLLGQIDRQIKRLADEGIGVLQQPVAPQLLKNLLYCIARARSTGERVASATELFRLSELLPGEIGEAGGGAPWGPDLEVLNSVSEAIMEDLAQVKDTLDIFVRSESSSPTDLEPMVETLKRVEDTLGLLGLGAARRTVKNQSAAIENILATGELPSEETLMGIAGALLEVDGALQAVAARGMGKAIAEAGPGLEPGMPHIGGHEQARIMAAVAAEAKRDLVTVKEGVTAYLGAPEEVGLLEPAIVHSKQVIGCLSMLSFVKAAGVLGDCNRYIKEVLEARSPNLPEEDKLQAFADSLTGIEYFLEAVEEGRTDLDDILGPAARRLETLALAPKMGVEEQDREIEEVSLAPEPEEQEEELASAEVLEEGTMAEEAEEITLETSAEENAAIDEEGEGPTDGGRVEEQLLPDKVADSPRAAQGAPRGVEGKEEEAPEQPVSESPEAMDSTVEGVEESLAEDPPREASQPVEAAAEEAYEVAEEAPAGISDPEILEIFIEEAGEVMDDIGAQFPVWKADMENMEPLNNIRRAFHTLKGSGRLVGATVIGELAWHMESMLNRVIDRTTSLSPAIPDLVEEVHGYLPALIGAFQAGGKVSIDVQALMDRADALGTPGAIVERGAGEKEGGMTPTGGGAAGPAMESPGSGGGETADAEEDPGALPESETEIDQGEDNLEGPPGEGLEKEVPSERHTTTEAVAPASAQSADSTILDVFRCEAATHLVTLQTFLASAGGDAPEPAPVTKELVVACHTLHGGARVAGVPEVAELFGLLETALSRLAGRGLPLLEEDLPILWASADLLAAAVKSLETGAGHVEPQVELLRRIRALERSAAKRPMAGKSASGEESRAGPAAAPKGSPDTGGDEEEDLVDELREVFIEEADEILAASDAIMRRWREDASDPELVKELQRQLHTLKGGARMAELPAMGDLSHAVESALTLVVDGLLPVDGRLRDLVQSSHDRLAEMLDAVRDRRVPRASQDLVDQINELISPGTAMIFSPDADADPETREETTPIDEIRSVEKAPAAGPQGPEMVVAGKEDGAPGSRDKEDRVQVRADALDNFVNYAGEMSIARARVEQQMGELKYSLEEMDQTVNRLRGQLRDVEIEAESQILYRHETPAAPEDEDFDPLEFDRFTQMQQLSRGLLESVSDLESIQNLLEDLTRESESILVQQARINTDLQQGLMNMRLLPVARHVPRLRRIVRQTAKSLKKKVELHVRGQNEELDHTILGRIVAPLEHMLRNAVDHGIEMPRERLKQGKPETGVIHLSVSRDGAEAVIRISDDGRGLDLDAIRRKAVDRGLLSHDVRLDDDELVQFVFEQAFSTAAEVTQISGRGVGLDVVSAEVKQLGGSLQADSKSGAGTTFIIRLPTTLSVAQALMVMVGDELFAVPLASVEGIVRFTQEQITELLAEEAPVFQHVGNSYQVIYLGDPLGLGEAWSSQDAPRHPALLARAGEHRMAFIVDRLSGRQEVVIKPVGAQLATIRWIAGATILGDGRVVLILDVPALIRKGMVQPTVTREIAVAGPAPLEEGRPPLVMVVDDSITVRKVTQRFLLRNGMGVLLAKDGLEALAMLQDHKPDVLLLDVEMPRMDGYELATTVRNDGRFQDLPIVMITSRTGTKHFERAKKIGVNHYLGKPYHEGELLTSIQELLVTARA